MTLNLHHAPLTRLLAVLVAVCSLVAAVPADAATWQVAPLFGGEVRSLAFSPGDPSAVLAGTTSGQVYLSSDAGRTWAPAGRVYPLPGWVVEALVPDPERPRRVWAGLRGVWGGGAVALSEDFGASWQVRSRLSDDTLYSLALLPGGGDRLVVGTRSGVWASSDGAATWRHLTADEPEIIEVSSLLVDPREPGTLIAGTFRRAYRTLDAGRTWRSVFDGMALDSQVFSMSAVPGKPGEVWASTCGWVYRSLDGGGRWKRSQEGLVERRTPYITALPTGRLLAGTVSGVFVSDDAGGRWDRRSRPDLSVFAIAHHPERPEVVLVGTEGSGVWRSDDGGSSFRPSSSGMASPRIAALAAGDGELLVAVAHGGPASGLYGSSDGGRRILQQYAELPTVLSLQLSQHGAWAATEQGLWRRRNGVWEPVPGLDEGRVEQVAFAGGRMFVRTFDAVLEERGGRFHPLPLGGDRPASLVVRGDEVWISGGDRLYRVTRGGVEAVASPVVAARLAGFGERLLVTGAGGAWSGLGGGWDRHSEERSRAVPTGDPAWPAVLVSESSAWLLHAIDGALVPLELPFAAREVLAAAVHEGRLFLGTAGYGLISTELAAFASPAGGGTIAASP
jgi:photosystem II stability/assembly factor-like uncharacterized protein